VGLPAFERCGILRGQHEAVPGDFRLAVTWAAQQRGKAAGWTVLTGLTADAEPGAAVVRGAWESLRDGLIEDLKAALPVDAVALNLHGGMVAEGHDDCEGDLISRVRALAGPDAVIGALCDPHAHLSQAMLEGADLLLFYKENPHSDIEERAGQLIELIDRVVRREIRPVTSVFNCRLMDVFQTNREPMRGLVDELKSLEGKDGILDISVVHGFRRADIPIVGAWTLVITDDRKAAGDALARRLGERLIAMRGAAAQPDVPLEEAVRRVVEATRVPIVLADLADNPGGGSPGDSTFILRALLDAGVRDVAAGILWDPLAVRFAFEAGEGAMLQMRVGGKACPLSGKPLDLEVRVGRLLEDAVQRIGGISVSMGRLAALHADGLDILVAEKRTQTYAANLFAEAGVDLASKRAIVVKSAQHYRRDFSAIFAEDIVVDAPGVCASDVRRLAFHRIPRPIWPFDPNPWEPEDR
jgi:microcystin degradation protein MlrC